MIVSDTEMMELGIRHATNIHNTRLLIRTLKNVLDILQTEESFTVKEYKHTHTHTNTSTQTFSILHHVLFLSYTYFLVCPHLIYFLHICIYVFISESDYFRKFIAASQLKKINVSLKARHA